MALEDKITIEDMSLMKSPNKRKDLDLSENLGVILEE